MVLPPSSRRQAALVRAALNPSNLLCVNTIPNKKTTRWVVFVLVDLGRFVSNCVAAVQPAASGARPRRIELFESPLREYHTK
jgi:hypothetical protein